ncbi:MAG TPA: glycoside hydrolase family 30 beta sandwich domain-containing protein [Polyangia bacterium]|nr:glycoside hydrolase family 30 beta sandwich domain-containing protein [Polyangia bacterium]
MNRFALRTGMLWAAFSVAACGTSEDPTQLTVVLDIGVPHQTLAGFGAATAYQANLLSSRGEDRELYRLLFVDSGLDVLRLGNWYQNQGPNTTPSSPFTDQAAVQIVQRATAARGGTPPKILMSGWTPPAYLKSNGVTRPPYGSGTTIAAGTLIQKEGAYAYADYADWWVRSLQAYAAQGIAPDYVSIQNEPDFFTRYWETCVFGATEGATVEGIPAAGYGQALSAVAGAVQAAGLASPPTLLGPETTGFTNSVVQRYVNGMNAAQVGGVAHHLYGVTGANPSPDAFNDGLRDVARTAAALGLPSFMTEYSPDAPTMFDTALLIHNAVTIGNASAYIYWELIWNESNPQTGLVALSPGSPSAPFTVNDTFYALKHFARWTDPGWVRVDARSSGSSLRVSAFASPDGNTVTMVLLNTDSKVHFVTLDPGQFPFSHAEIRRSSGDSERTALVTMEPDGTLALPPRSIATVTLTLTPTR